MSLPARIFALAALVPATLGPSLTAGSEALTVALCGGGSISIPTGSPLQNNGTAPCCAKGCHADDKRKRTGARRAAI